MRAVMEVSPERVTIQFQDIPPRSLRDVLKAWRFRYDGSRWERDAAFRVGSLIDELARFRSIEWEYRLVLPDGSTRPATVHWEYLKPPRLVPVEESAAESSESATAESSEPATTAEIEAVRCWECGRLDAVDPHQQAELTRRQRQAVDEMRAALEAAGLGGYLAAAPVPEGVKVVRQRLCRTCRAQGF